MESSNHNSPNNNDLQKPTNPVGIKRRGLPGISQKRTQVQRTIAYHMAGIGEKSGLLFKALEYITDRLSNGTPAEKEAATDRVIKLLPYVTPNMRDQGASGMGGNGLTPQTVNIQFNNFDSHLKERLAQTNLGKLIAQSINQSIEPIESIESITQESQSSTPPPTPGG